MAYSNWGARTHCDGQAKYENCDATPKQVLAGTHYAHYMAHFIKGQEDENYRKDPMNEMYHAVVGDAEAGVLVCLYKDILSKVYALGRDGSVEQIELPESPTYDWEADRPRDYSLTVGGATLHAWGESFPSSVRCELKDAKGREWRVVSGYGLGEGFEEWE